MQDVQQQRLFPEKGPERTRDTILSLVLGLTGSLFLDDQEIFQSDVLYVPAVIQDLFGGMGLQGWSFTPAVYFFPDITLYGILFSVLNHSLALRLYGILQASFIAFLLMRLFSPPGKRYGIFRLLFSLQFLSLIYLQDFYAFLYLPGMHCSAFLVTLALFHRIRKETLLPWKGIYIILLGLVIASDRIFLLYAIVPALISLLFARRLRKKNPDYAKRVPSPRIQYWLKVLFASAAFGLLLQVAMGALLSKGKPAGIPALQSLLALIRDFNQGFGTPNLFYIQLAVFAVFSALLLHRVLLATEKEIRRADRPSLIFYGRISSSNLLLFLWLAPLDAIATGAYVDPYSIRYFAGSLIVSNAGALSILCNIRNKPTAHLSRFTGPLSMAFRRSGPVAASLMLLALALGDRFLLRPSLLEYGKHGEDWPLYYPNHVACLDSHLEDGATVMADYWHAKSIYLFSRASLISYHADYVTGLPSRTIANTNWWRDGWPPEAVYMANLSPEVITKALGTPTKTLKCKTGPDAQNPEAVDGKSHAGGEEPAGSETTPVPLWIYGSVE